MLERYSSNHERDVILQALESVTFPESSRRNVRQAHDVRPNRAMCLGMTQCYFKGPMPSRCTREYPNLARLLCAWARRELPSFEFTSIQVNKDCAAALHVDSNDAGSSYIIGLGKYVGGQLWIGDGPPLGRLVDLRGRWCYLDGNLPHRVLPFRGRRYTVVFFSRVKGGDVGKDPESRFARALLGLGFPLPPKMPNLRNYVSKKERLDLGRLQFLRFCSRVARRGGLGRKRLQVRLPGCKVIRVAVAPDLTVGVLTQALAERYGFTQPVHLQSASYRLLPGDAVDLGIDQVLNVVVPSTAQNDSDGALPTRCDEAPSSSVAAVLKTKSVHDEEDGNASKRQRSNAMCGVPGYAPPARQSEPGKRAQSCTDLPDVDDNIGILEACAENPDECHISRVSRISHVSRCRVSLQHLLTRSYNF